MSFYRHGIVADKIVIEDKAAEAVGDFVEGDAGCFGTGKEDAVPLIGEGRVGMARQIGHDGILLQLVRQPLAARFRQVEIFFLFIRRFDENRRMHGEDDLLAGRLRVVKLLLEEFVHLRREGFDWMLP